jgi:hypothetical protein
MFSLYYFEDYVECISLVVFSKNYRVIITTIWKEQAQNWMLFLGCQFLTSIDNYGRPSEVRTTDFF